MKTPTEEEIIQEAVFLKELMGSVDFQMGIGEHTEKAMINRLNKIIRMLRQPIRRVDLYKLSEK